MGVAILSQLPVLSVRSVALPNPGWRIEVLNKSFSSHPKGALIANIEGPAGRFSLACIHLLPVKLFGLREDSSVALDYLRLAMAELGNQAPSIDIVAGDFNNSHRVEVMSNLGFSSSTFGRSTRVSGESHDDIMYGSRFHSSMMNIRHSESDHHLVFGTLLFDG